MVKIVYTPIHFNSVVQVAVVLGAEDSEDYKAEQYVVMLVYTVDIWEELQELLVSQDKHLVVAVPVLHSILTRRLILMAVHLFLSAMHIVWAHRGLEEEAAMPELQITDMDNMQPLGQQILAVVEVVHHMDTMESAEVGDPELF